MIDLVKTHLTHPWGPPWTLETLGGPWRPLATLGDMLENDHFGGNWSFSSMSPRVAKGVLWDTLIYIVIVYYTFIQVVMDLLLVLL